MMRVWLMIALSACLVQPAMSASLEPDKSASLKRAIIKKIAVAKQRVLAKKAPAFSRLDPLPDGFVSTARKNGIRGAAFTAATGRYGHGILGDAIEASELTIIGKGNKTQSIKLSTDVFEDLTPRLADLDKDGSPEIVTIQTSQTKGGSIAIYGFRDGTLSKLAQTPYIGRSNRWMNIAGIADFNGDGLTEIALVDRPHIHGELEYWTYTNSKQLKRRAALLGFSNHYIGSRELDLSAVIELNGKTLLALPSTDRRAVHLVDARESTPISVAKYDLPARISHNFTKLVKDGQTSLGIRLGNDTMIVLAVKP